MNISLRGLANAVAAVTDNIVKVGTRPPPPGLTCTVVLAGTLQYVLMYYTLDIFFKKSLVHCVSNNSRIKNSKSLNR